jgi:hypothetical protein
MTRGLQPRTTQQRAAREGGGWKIPRGPKVEMAQPPLRRVGQSLAALLATLLAILAGVGLFVRATEHRRPIGAHEAAARFTTAGPPLLRDPRAERLAVEAPAVASLKREDSAGQAAIAQAMREVVAEGWGDAAPPPPRADTALTRARAQ